MRGINNNPGEELFDVVNKKDEVVGQAKRREVHKDPNLIHRVVHVWIINDKGEILIQQRSLSKDREPGKWDISCGGHVRSDQSLDLTAERELAEELGIKAKCIFIKKYLQKFEDETEMVNLYYAIHNGPFTFNDGEVEQVKFFSKDDALAFIQTDPDVSFFSKQQIPLIFDFLEHNRK